MAWHKVITATPHPYGKPWGYCSRCSYVVVQFQDQWWHLQKKAQHRLTKRVIKGRDGERDQKASDSDGGPKA